MAIVIANCDGRKQYVVSGLYLDIYSVPVAEVLDDLQYYDRCENRDRGHDDKEPDEPVKSM